MLVAVSVFPLRDSKVLAMRRSASRDAAPGIWETVSGRLEEGEDPYDCATRELLEETSLGGSVNPQPLDAYRAQRGDEPMIVIVYQADCPTGEVRISHEHDAHRWCTIEEFSHLSRLDRLVAASKRIVLC